MKNNKITADQENNDLDLQLSMDIILLISVNYKCFRAPHVPSVCGNTLCAGELIPISFSLSKALLLVD
jgi:hypothetical protein